MSSEYTDALPTGLKLEGYEIVRVLGVGGFGVTYLGFDDKLNMAVAIKEYLPSDLARRDSSQTVTPRSTKDTADFQWGLDRFLSEAQDLARFDHPNIIRVRRFFEAHGTAYIVMDYAEGETLAALIEHQGPLTEARVKDILLPLMDGLDEVHRADLLHRDIKPSNIIIKDDGQPVLIDFGAARQSTGARSRSMTAVLTPGYAPLEQYSAKGNQGAWTDIYALAAVAYRALTGITPEEATNRIKNDPLVPAVTAGKSQASSAFLKALDWALAVDEEERPQTIAAFRAALIGEAPAITKTPQTKPSQPAGGKINIKDNRIVITIGAIFLLGLPLGFTSLLIYLGQKTQPDLQSTQTQPDLQGTRLVTAIQIELDRLDYVLEADGVFGAGTCARITAYQKAHYLSVNCTPSMELLDHLQQAAAPKGLKETKRRAQWGDAKYQNILGVRYDTGNGVTKDDAKAVEWYRKAAKQGHAWGHSNLGAMYHNGEGVAKDYAKALEWFRKAAKQGNVHGQNWLGSMYYRGEGVTRDYAKAVEWFRKAAKQGYANGQSWLGWMYYKGEGVAKNRSIACDWWRKAAAQNDPDAKERLKEYCS